MKQLSLLTLRTILICVVTFQANSHQNSNVSISMCGASRQLIGWGRQEHQS